MTVLGSVIIYRKSSYVCLPLLASLFLCVRLYLCWCVCLFVCLSVCVSLCLSLSLSLCVRLSLSLLVCLSLCLSVCVSLCVSLSVCLCLSLLIETAHPSTRKRLLCVSNKTPNHMVYDDTGRYPLYIQSTLSFLRYWLKLRRMPTERFPKQALIMMQNDIYNNGSRNTRCWASDIKHCLESYGFQDVWTGEVANETALFSFSIQVQNDRTFSTRMVLKGVQ